MQTETSQAFSIRHKIISYPAFTEAMARIERLHRRSLTTGHSGGLLITGLSGSGKSTVGNEYLSRFKSYESDEVTIMPVLKVDTPAGPTVKNLAEEILIGLRDPMAHIGTTEQKTQRIYHYLKLSKVELVIIDEFQHFIENAKRSETARVTDWLKNIINKSNIPVVLLGLPSSEYLLHLNPQLARRFSARYSLRPFTFYEAEDIQEFRSVLNIVEKSLPLQSVPLTEPGMSQRFHIATFGLIDFIGKIVDTAVMVAVDEGAKKIQMRHYAMAFMEEVWRDVPDQLNPFVPNAKLRALNQPNEPFAVIGGEFGKAELFRSKDKRARDN
jgi:hypothetical protein